MIALAEYRVRARNCSTDSENTIHADEAARQFGFRGGLVPGIVVYGYALTPVLRLYGPAWLERGAVHIKLQQPVYDGDAVLVRSQTVPEAGPVEITLSVQPEDENVCATAQAKLAPVGAKPQSPRVDDYPERPLPKQMERPPASFETLIPGTALGTVRQKLDSTQSRVFAALETTDRLFLGPDALAHPAMLLELANQALMQNVRLGPWLHAASTVTNWSSARNGEDVQVRSRVEACFERKGHEFVILDLVIAGPDRRLIQHVSHTAIFRPNFVTAS